MLLKTVTISGFKSFRKTVELPVSNRTTVLVGPNDHGKTNALLAVDKLNAAKTFESSEINDRLQGPDAAYISYKFSITESEAQALMKAAEAAVKKTETTQTPPGATTVIEAISDSLVHMSEVLQLQPWLEKLRGRRELEFIRQPGKTAQVKLDELQESVRPSVRDAALTLIPTVFLFTPEALRQLPDTVDQAGLDKNEVMQGVFRLAGIWEERTKLLSGNTRKNQDDLREASEILTRKIRLNWTQGLDLEFYLEYVGNNVRLTVKDTAKSVTAVSERSEGFTAYFAMRMLLVARTNSAQPNGYVFMFDEPGLNLHPKGQIDLQNVFEDISRKNQIIYSTHSVFLINKNYPDRNHLVFKNQDGSNIDNKPFVGGWAKVKEHLGLYLSSNFLFSDKVLLAEGSTDEIYIPLIIQGLVERNYFSGDLNGFAIHSGYTELEMIGAASMFIREDRHVAVLVDGDEEGNKKKRRVEQWSSRSKYNCPVLSLGDFKKSPCSIEDFLEPATFREAVAAACKEAIKLGILQAKSDAWENELRQELETKGEKSLGKRVDEVLPGLFGGPISDVWIARKYGELLQADKTPNGADFEPYWKDEILTRLAKAIWNALDLPERGDITEIPLTSNQ